MAGPIKTDDRPEIKLSKLLPAEVTGLYVTISGLVSTAKTPNTDRIMLIVIALICVAGLFYMVKTLKITNKIHLAVYTISFILWSATLNVQTIEVEGIFGGDQKDLPLWIAIVATLWTFLVPMFVTSEMVASQAADGTPLTKREKDEVDDVVPTPLPIDPNNGAAVVQ